jgi:hypothetical protein
MPERDAALFVVSTLQGPKTVQAISDPLPHPHGEKLEVSGSISTRYSRSPDTGGSSIVRALIHIWQTLASKSRTNAILVCSVEDISDPMKQAQHVH